MSSSRLIESFLRTFLTKSKATGSPTKEKDIDSVLQSIKSLYVLSQDDSISQVNPGVPKEFRESIRDTFTFERKSLPKIDSGEVESQTFRNYSIGRLGVSDDIKYEDNPFAKAQQNIKDQLAFNFGLKLNKMTQPPNGNESENNKLGYQDRMNYLTKILVKAATLSQLSPSHHKSSSQDRTDEQWMQVINDNIELPTNYNESDIQKRLTFLLEKSKYLETKMKEVVETSGVIGMPATAVEDDPQRVHYYNSIMEDAARRTPARSRNSSPIKIAFANHVSSR
jgi:hypothetical protein